MKHRHNEPDRDGDANNGLHVALCAEGLVVCLLLAAIFAVLGSL